MSAEQSIIRRKWLGEAAVGLYAGVGAVALRQCLLWALAAALSGLVRSAADGGVGRLFLAQYPVGYMAVLLPISALLAWGWLGLARRTALPARLGAAAAIAAAGFGNAWHLANSSPEAKPWAAGPAPPLALAALVGMALLLFLPWPATRRAVQRSAGARVILMIVPLLAVAWYAGGRVQQALEAQNGRQRLQSVELPLPPGAANVGERSSPRARFLKFTVRAPYPSMEVADFYTRHFAALGWRPRFLMDWSRSGPEGGPGIGTGNVWDDPEGELQCVVSLTYEPPRGADRSLPREQGKQEWLQVQHVTVMILPAQGRR